MNRLSIEGKRGREREIGERRLEIGGERGAEKERVSGRQGGELVEKPADEIVDRISSKEEKRSMSSSQDVAESSENFMSSQGIARTFGCHWASFSYSIL